MEGNTIQKAIAVLNFISKEPYYFTAMEISEGLSLNRSSVHRILSSLMDEGMVLQSRSNRKYKLGPLSYHIGASYLHNMNYMEDIHAIVEKTAEKIQMSVGYAVLENGKIMTVYEVEGYISVRMGYKPGTFYPIHCGAYGKTITAFHKPLSELREMVYSADLEKRTDMTITDPELLLKEYERIRNHGYCISNEENAKGAIGVGAPVRNSKGVVIASIAAAGIKAGVDNNRLNEIKEVIINAAKEISALIP